MRPMLALLVVALACTPANAGSLSAPARPSVAVVAAGDTATLVVTWAAMRGATGYLGSVKDSASNGTWTGEPVRQVVSSQWTLFVISSTADSAYFRVTLWSTQSGRVSADSGMSAWVLWRRTLHAPTPTVNVSLKLFDTLGGVALTAAYGGLPVNTQIVNFGGRQLWNVTAAAYSERTQLCPFVVFSVDTVAIAKNWRPHAGCLKVYTDSTAAGRWQIATVAQQALADSTCWSFTAPTGSFIPGTGVWQAPAGPQIVILTSTMADCAGRVPGSVSGRFLPPPGTQVVTCHRAGPVFLVATNERGQTERYRFICPDSTAQFILPGRPLPLPPRQLATRSVP